MVSGVLFLSRRLEGGCGRIGPGQELVETALGMAVDDAADHVGQVGPPAWTSYPPSSPRHDVHGPHSSSVAPCSCQPGRCAPARLAPGPLAASETTLARGALLESRLGQ